MLQQFYPQIAHPFRYELNKDMNFAAAHLVAHVGAGQCSNMHGHTYFVNITVVGDELDEQGFLVNFQKLKKLVHGQYDHAVMNRQAGLDADFGGDSTKLATTENVARVIWQNIQHYLDTASNHPRCLQVLLRETPTSYVVFRPKEEDFNGLQDR